MGEEPSHLEENKHTHLVSILIVGPVCGIASAFIALATMAVLLDGVDGFTAFYVFLLELVCSALPILLLPLLLLGSSRTRLRPVLVDPTDAMHSTWMTVAGVVILLASLGVRYSLGFWGNNYYFVLFLGVGNVCYSIAIWLIWRGRISRKSFQEQLLDDA